MYYIFLLYIHPTGRTLVSAETSSVDLSKEGGEVDNTDESTDSNTEKNTTTTDTTPLTTTQAEDMCEWLKVTLGNKVSTVKVTNRLSDSPAIVTDHESGALRRMMKMVVSVCISEMCIVSMMYIL